MAAGVFVGTVYCPTCGVPVECTSHIAMSGIRREGADFRVSTTDATARHKCKADR